MAPLAPIRDPAKAVDKLPQVGTGPGMFLDLHVQWHQHDGGQRRSLHTLSSMTAAAIPPH